MDRALLILELDETLVYATKKRRIPGHDLRIRDSFVHRRPHLDRFMEQVFNQINSNSSGTHVAAPFAEISTVKPYMQFDAHGVRAR